MALVAVGNIKGRITGKSGYPIMIVILKDATHAPEHQFNLLSLTKIINEG